MTRLYTTPALVILSLVTGCGSQGTGVSADSQAGAAAGVVSAAGAAGLSSSAGTSPAGRSGIAGNSSTPASGGAGSGNASAAGSGGASATAGAPGAGGTIPATFATVKLVFGGGGGIMTCAAAPCHGVNGAAPPDRPLELPTNDDQRLYTNLTSYVSKACNNTKLVTPGDPTQSALVKILKGPCGSTPRMPYDCSAEAGDCIPAEYIAAIEQWIATGAQR